MTTYTFDMDLKTLTSEQLDEFRTLCWAMPSKIEEEITRRAALPWVWRSEEKTVHAIRAALQKPDKRGVPNPEEWVKPTSPLDAYVGGDVVLYKGSKYTATGSGTIMISPEEVDPVQGVHLWTPEGEVIDSNGEVISSAA